MGGHLRARARSFAAVERADNANRELLTLTNTESIERNQSCNTSDLEHEVRIEGCEPKMVKNRRVRAARCAQLTPPPPPTFRFCHGACTSLYIPKSRSSKIKATFRSCAACVPVETSTRSVTLECPQRAASERRLERKVVIIERCACRNVRVDELDDADDDYP